MDTSVAEAYERLLVPTLNTRLAGEAVERAALLPGESILDVACGTGITIRLAMPRLNPGGRTTGVDIDPAMLAVASSLVSSGNGVTFEWRCASAQELPFEKGSFDAAFCLQGLQYLPDPAAAMTEMRRVMKAGGRMVSVVWTSLDDCKGQLALARALERRNIEATSIRKAYSFGDPGRVRKLASGAGFRDVEIRTGSTAARFSSVARFVEAFASGSLSSRAVIARVPASERNAFLGEIAAELRPYEIDGGVELPLGYLMMIART